MTSHVARLGCTRAEAQAALARDPFEALDPEAVLVASETADRWELALYCTGPPTAALLEALAALAPSSRRAPQVEALEPLDWVVESQAGLAPVDAGRFHVFPGHRRGEARPGQIAIRIDAGQAFGTGQHATTRGCLLLLDRWLKANRPRRLLDLGTGSAVLAIAAARAQPRTQVVATDIDATALGVARRHARANRASAIRFARAAGLKGRQLLAATPYDLVLANLLAPPLIALSAAMAAVVRGRGHVILAGLLERQEQAIRAAYRAQGFRPVARLGGEWPVLLLERRGGTLPRGAIVRAARRGRAAGSRSAGTI